MTRHARSRAAERYEVDVTAGDIANALCDIQNGRAILARRRNNGTSEWLVTVNGQTMRAVVCPSADAIVTMLPPQPHREELLRRYAKRKGAIGGLRPKQRRTRGIIEELD